YCFLPSPVGMRRVGDEGLARLSYTVSTIRVSGWDHLIPPAYAGGTDCANSSLASHRSVVPELSPHPGPLPKEREKSGLIDAGGEPSVQRFNLDFSLGSHPVNVNRVLIRTTQPFRSSPEYVPDQAYSRCVVCPMTRPGERCRRC